MKRMAMLAMSGGFRWALVHGRARRCAAGGVSTGRPIVPQNSRPRTQASRAPDLSLPAFSFALSAALRRSNIRGRTASANASMLCDRASPERHSDRAADALPLGARLIGCGRTHCRGAKPPAVPRVNSHRASSRTMGQLEVSMSKLLTTVSAIGLLALDRAPWRGQRQRANWHQHEDLEFDRGQLGAASLSDLPALRLSAALPALRLLRRRAVSCLRL